MTLSRSESSVTRLGLANEVLSGVGRAIKLLVGRLVWLVVVVGSVRVPTDIPECPGVAGIRAESAK